MPLTLINGWRWRTHVAVLMRQFVQFCKKTMAVHFIAMCLLGYISTATSFRSEEFRPAINQRTPLYQRSAPYFSFFNGTCVVCGSIQMQSLKSASFFCSVNNTQSEAGDAVASRIPLRVCRKPAVEHFIIVFQASHLKNKRAATLLGCVSSGVGTRLGTLSLTA